MVQYEQSESGTGIASSATERLCEERRLGRAALPESGAGCPFATGGTVGGSIEACSLFLRQNAVIAHLISDAMNQDVPNLA